MAVRFFFLMLLMAYSPAHSAILRIGQHDNFIRFVVESPSNVMHNVTGEIITITTKSDFEKLPTKYPQAIKSIKKNTNQSISITMEKSINKVSKQIIDKRSIFDVTLSYAIKQLPIIPTANKTETITATTEKSPIINNIINEASIKVVSDNVQLFIPDGNRAGLAVFNRAGYQWIVTSHRWDESQIINSKIIQNSSVKTGDKWQTLRFKVIEKKSPAIWYEGGGWFITFQTTPNDNALIMPQSIENNQLLINVQGASPVIKITDPDLSDNLWIVTSNNLNVGVNDKRQFALVALENTDIGMVLSSFQPDAEISQQGDKIIVQLPNTKAPEKSKDADIVDIKKIPTTTAIPKDNKVEQLFPIKEWRTVNQDNFFLKKQDLQRRIANSDVTDKPSARLTLARLLFAFNFYTESKAILQGMLTDDLQLHSSRPIKSLYGATLFMDHEYSAANKALFESGVADMPEGKLWLTAALSAEGKYQQAQQFSDAIIPIPDDYTPTMTIALLESLAQMWINTGHFDTAKLYLDRCEMRDFSDSQRGRFELLRANLLNATKETTKAKDLLQKLSSNDDQYVRTRSEYAIIDADLKNKKITDDDAIKKLQRLSFAWRGDSFEIKILYKLVELYKAGNSYRSALQTLRYLEKQYPDSDYGKQANKDMQQLFTDLYLNAKADELPPLTALSLLDEFRFLTPDDERGDEIIRKLADRLVAVDLLDRAGDLLTHQIKERLQGEDKSRIGMQLAMIYLLDDKPTKVIEALNLSDYLYVPVALYEKRERIRAQAYAMQGNNDDAIETLMDDTSPEADLIRVNVYWKQKNYPAMIHILAGMINVSDEKTTISNDNAKIILNYAMALVMTKDTKTLAAIFDRYNPIMKNTPFAATFETIANPDLMGGNDISQAIRDIATIDTLVDKYRKELKNSKLSDMKAE